MGFLSSFAVYFVFPCKLQGSWIKFFFSRRRGVVTSEVVFFFVLDNLSLFSKTVTYPKKYDTAVNFFLAVISQNFLLTVLKLFKHFFQGVGKGFCSVFNFLYVYLQGVWSTRYAFL